MFLRQLMEVPGNVDLRSQDGVEALRCQRRDDPVIQDTCRVYHDTDPVLGQQAFRGRPVGQVTGHHLDLRALLRQLGHQLSHARRRRAPATDQQELARRVSAYKMPGDEAAERASATGDQNSAGQLRRYAGRSTRPREPWHPDGVTAHHCIRLAGGHDPGQHPQRVVRDSAVHQEEAARVLGLSRADQATGGGRAQVDDVRAGQRYRALGQHHQPR
jgi:hypothetical protein